MLEASLQLVLQVLILHGQSMLRSLNFVIEFSTQLTHPINLLFIEDFQLLSEMLRMLLRLLGGILTLCDDLGREFLVRLMSLSNLLFESFDARDTFLLDSCIVLAEYCRLPDELLLDLLQVTDCLLELPVVFMAHLLNLLVEVGKLCLEGLDRFFDCFGLTSKVCIQVVDELVYPTFLLFHQLLELFALLICLNLKLFLEQI